MRRHLGLVVLAATAGAGAGALGVSQWPASESPAPTSAARSDGNPEESRRLDDIVEALTRTLNDEINERRILSDQVEQLTGELRDLRDNLRVRVEEAFQAEENSRPEQAAQSGSSSLEERLAAAGFTPQMQQTIARLQAETQMRRIELDDKARREGWIDTPRYVREMQELSTGSSAIRRSIGDEAYDRYLYALGSPNRVAVRSIIDISPASKAGFRIGDVVIRYGGENVYFTHELTELRSSGESGAPVAVDVLRDGRVVQLTIPRGPMGITTRPTRVDPDSSGQ